MGVRGQVDRTGGQDGWTVTGLGLGGMDKWGLGLGDRVELGSGELTGDWGQSGDLDRVSFRKPWF